MTKMQPRPTKMNKKTNKSFTDYRKLLCFQSCLRTDTEHVHKRESSVITVVLCIFAHPTNGRNQRALYGPAAKCTRTVNSVGSETSAQTMQLPIAIALCTSIAWPPKTPRPPAINNPCGKLSQFLSLGDAYPSLCARCISARARALTTSSTCMKWFLFIMLLCTSLSVCVWAPGRWRGERGPVHPVMRSGRLSSNAFLADNLSLLGHTARHVAGNSRQATTVVPGRHAFFYKVCGRGTRPMSK